jgi:hypothetical protein
MAKTARPGLAGSDRGVLIGLVRSVGPGERSGSVRRDRASMIYAIIQAAASARVAASDRAVRCSSARAILAALPGRRASVRQEPCRSRAAADANPELFAGAGHGSRRARVSAMISPLDRAALARPAASAYAMRPRIAQTA